MKVLNRNIAIRYAGQVVVGVYLGVYPKVSETGVRSHPYIEDNDWDPSDYAQLAIANYAGLAAEKLYIPRRTWRDMRFDGGTEVEAKVLKNLRSIARFNIPTWQTAPRFYYGEARRLVKTLEPSIDSVLTTYDQTGIIKVPSLFELKRWEVPEEPRQPPVLSEATLRKLRRSKEAV